MAAEPSDPVTPPPNTVIVRETRKGTFQQEILSGAHRLSPTSR